MHEIRLSDLRTGEVVNVLAGEDHATTEYRFEVLERGERPLCDFSQRPMYEDASAAPLKVSLDGPVKVLLEGCIEPTDVKHDDEWVVEEGDGMLWSGGVITIFDRRDTASPSPKNRHRLQPPIRDMFVRRVATYQRDAQKYLHE